MKPGEIAEVLERLHFEGDSRLIAIDKPVRDYLLAALAVRRGKA